MERSVALVVTQDSMPAFLACTVSGVGQARLNSTSTLIFVAGYDGLYNMRDQQLLPDFYILLSVEVHTL